MKALLITNIFILAICMVNISLPWRVWLLVWINKIYATLILMVVCAIASMRLYLETYKVPDNDEIYKRVFTNDPKEIRRRSAFVNIVAFLLYNAVIVFVTR